MMGETIEQHAERWRQPVVAKTLERGHGRGKTQPADRTDSALRGVPVIGHGSGAISGTAPGGELGAGARLDRIAVELNEAARKIVRDRTRYRS